MKRLGFIGFAALAFAFGQLAVQTLGSHGNVACAQAPTPSKEPPSKEPPSKEQPPEEQPRITPRASAQSAFEWAEQAVIDFEFQGALVAYEEAATLDTSAPFALTAKTRARDLRNHSEGGFAPLVALEKVRRDPEKNRNQEAIADLEQKALRFPNGRVRSEALLVVAQAYAHALNQPERAANALEHIFADAHAERTTKTLALSEYVTITRTLGRDDRALAALSRMPDLLPSVLREVRAEARRKTIANGAYGILLALLVMSVWGAIRAIQTGRDKSAISAYVLRPRVIAFAFFLGASGAVFARFAGEGGNPLPFIALGMGLALIIVLMRLSSFIERPETRVGKVLRGSIGALSVIAVAFLVLWKMGPDYLKSIGL